MSKLSGLQTLTKRFNSGLKPQKNMLGSNYFSTNNLSQATTDGSGGTLPYFPSSSNLTLNDGSDLTLSNGKSMGVMS